MNKSYDDMLNVPVMQENSKEAFVKESKKNRAKCYELAEHVVQQINRCPKLQIKTDFLILAIA